MKLKMKMKGKDQRYVKHYKNLRRSYWNVGHFHKGKPWIKDFKLVIKQLAIFLEEVRP